MPAAPRIRSARPCIANEGTRFPHRREVFPSWSEQSLVDDIHGGPAARAWSAVEQERQDGLHDAAVAIFLRWPGGRGGHDVVKGTLLRVRDDAPCAFVLGQHSAVDSPPLPGAALRHALVLAWPTARGERPRVEVIDLKTDVGIGIPHAGGARARGPGTAAAHVESSSTFRIGVGVADVCIVPLAHDEPLCPSGWRARMREAERAGVPVRRWRDDAAAGAAIGEAMVWHAALVAAEAARVQQDLGGPELHGDGDVMRIQVLPRPVDVERRWRESTVITSSVLCSPTRASRGLHGMHGMRGTHDVDDTRAPLMLDATWGMLEDGLLLGRYARCVGHGQLVEDDDSLISRVHACLLARRQQLYVVDVGSSNGTEVRGSDGVARELESNGRVARLCEGDALVLAGRRVVVRVVDAVPSTDGPAAP